MCMLIEKADSQEKSSRYIGFGICMTSPGCPLILQQPFLGKNHANKNLWVLHMLNVLHKKAVQTSREIFLILHRLNHVPQDLFSVGMHCTGTK